jgi:DNA processing protein
MISPPIPATVPAITEERLAWLALALTPQLGPRRILRAVDRIGSPAKILSLGLTQIEALQFPAESAQFIFDGAARRAADQQLEDEIRSQLPDLCRWSLP